MSKDSVREELQQAFLEPGDATDQAKPTLSTPPSTATSATDTVSTNDENARSCEEWELFAEFEEDSRPHSHAPSEKSGSWTGRSEAICLLDEEIEENPVAVESEDGPDESEEKEDPRDAPMIRDNLDETTSRDDDNPDSESLSRSARSESVSSAASLRPIAETPSRIQVLVRVRPPARGEPQADAVTVGDASNIIRVRSTQTGSVIDCAVDRVFMDSTTQRDVYRAVESGVRAVLEGVNATIFAYGQTGTGKTHTMFGVEADHDDDNSTSGWGLIPRALRDVIDQTDNMGDEGQVDLSCSFMQVYNERVFDLLTDPRRQKPLIVREQPSVDGGTAVVLQGLSRERISSLADALELVRKGRANRSMRETELNAASSRSHAIVQVCIVVTTNLPSGDKRIRTSRLNLVDLAGSEKWNTDIEMEDRHAAELKNINTSLSALGNCIAALAELGRRHIPYRDSTLTRLLQDSFGGNTLSFLIATVSPSQKSTEETIRTLQFADRARSVMQVIRVNESFSGSTELLAAKAQIKALRDRLAHEQRRRHETRLKEHEAVQREFASKLQGKDEEIQRLTRDNEVFTKWRAEDVTRIRMLEAKLKDVESQLLQREHQSSQRATGGYNDLTPSEVGQETYCATSNESDNQHEAREDVPNTCEGPESTDKKGLRRKPSMKGAVKGKHVRPGFAQQVDADGKRSKVKSYRSLLEKYALGTQSSNTRDQDVEARTNPRSTKVTKVEEPLNITRPSDAASGVGTMRIAEPSPPSGEKVHQIARSASKSSFPSPAARGWNQQTATHPIDTYKSFQAAQQPPSPQRYTTDSTCHLALFKTDSLPILPRHQPPSALPYESSGNPLMFARAVGLTTLSDDHIMKQAWQLPPVQSAPIIVQDTAAPDVRSDGAAVVPQEVCGKHSLKGCVLCAVKDCRPTLVSSNPVKDPIKPTHTSFSHSSASDLSTTSMAVDANRPCDRHQLPGCFLCSKSSSTGSWKSTSSIPVLSSRTSSNVSFNAYVSTSIAAEQLQGSKPLCTTHMLANCVLCAGISNRSSVSTEPISPVKRSGYEPVVASLSCQSLPSQPSPAHGYSTSGNSVSSSSIRQDMPPNAVFQSSTSSPSPITRHTLKELAVDNSARRHFRSLVREASDAANIVLRHR